MSLATENPNHTDFKAERDYEYYNQIDECEKWLKKWLKSNKYTSLNAIPYNKIMVYMGLGFEFVDDEIGLDWNDMLDNKNTVKAMEAQLMLGIFAKESCIDSEQIGLYLKDHMKGEL